MKKFLNRVFKLDKKNTTVKKEILGGLLTFIAMCYILPVNASIMIDAGMNKAGVFIMTAIISCICTLLMAFLANLPVVVSTGMGINAFFTYTLCVNQGYTWQQGLILLTLSGLLFLIFSLTPIRKKIIEAIPKDLKHIISIGLGAFICFVGLRNSGIIEAGSTLVQFASFSDPAVLIGFIGIVLCFGFYLSRRKTLKLLAIPLSILIVVTLGLIISSILIKSGYVQQIGGTFMYLKGIHAGSKCTLPVLPWLDETLNFGVDGIKEVVFYGLLTDSYSGSDFGSDILFVFSKPASYMAIFSVLLVQLFDTTSTLVAVGENIGLINEKGEFENYKRVTLADSIGSTFCSPFGSTTVTSFAESNVGIAAGAKTGLASFTAALMLLLSGFIFPVFSIFTCGSVTVSALVCVGAMIFADNIRQVDFKKPDILYSLFINIIFTLLTYSLTTGVGVTLICYTVMMMFEGKKKEVKPAIYIMAIIFLISFIINAILENI